MALNFGQKVVLEGLGSVMFVAPYTGLFTLSVQSSLPIDRDGSPSELLIEIEQEAVNVYTGEEGASGAEIKLQCDADDEIEVILSSSATVDQSKNVIKSVMTFSQVQI